MDLDHHGSADPRLQALTPSQCEEVDRPGSVYTEVQRGRCLSPEVIVSIVKP